VNSLDPAGKVCFRDHVALFSEHHPHLRRWRRRGLGLRLGAAAGCCERTDEQRGHASFEVFKAFWHQFISLEGRRKACQTITGVSPKSLGRSFGATLGRTAI